MTPTITAFEDSPDGGKGLARDMRVRWALEEVGQPYAVRLISMAALKEPEHLSLNPFGSIPTYEEGDLTLFESGAIILHIATHHQGMLPNDADARERAIAWMFAALNTVEPPIVEREMATELERDESWYKARLLCLEERVRNRLNSLSDHLGDADWLDGSFSAADLLMIEVLLRLEGALLDEFPNLCAYVARGQAGRPSNVLSPRSAKCSSVEPATPNPSVEARPNGRPPGPGWWYAYIFTSPGLASCRWSRLTSNVRRHAKA